MSVLAIYIIGHIIGAYGAPALSATACNPNRAHTIVMSIIVLIRMNIGVLRVSDKMIAALRLHCALKHSAKLYLILDFTLNKC